MEPNGQSLTVDTLRSYVVPEEKADYMVPFSGQANMEVDVNVDPRLTGSSSAQPLPESGVTMRSNLRLFPPPLFSRQTIPQAYKYANAYTTLAKLT